MMRERSVGPDVWRRVVQGQETPVVQVQPGLDARMAEINKPMNTDLARSQSEQAGLNGMAVPGRLGSRGSDVFLRRHLNNFLQGPENRRVPCSQPEFNWWGVQTVGGDGGGSGPCRCFLGT